MAAHITFKTKAFMGSHTAVNTAPSTGHKVMSEENSVNPNPTKGHRTTENFKPANPHSPTNGPPAQTTTVSLPGVPIKTGTGDPVGSVK